MDIESNESMRHFRSSGTTAYNMQYTVLQLDYQRYLLETYKNDCLEWLSMAAEKPR